MKRLFTSFRYALSGLRIAVTHERNLKIHMIFALSVTIAGFFFNLSSIEWCILVLTIGGMFVCELLNTAIERTVDLVTKDTHPLAKEAKDIAAAACFVFAAVSVMIGIIIFLPKIMERLVNYF